MRTIVNDHQKMVIIAVKAETLSFNGDRVTMAIARREEVVRTKGASSKIGSLSPVPVSLYTFGHPNEILLSGI